MKDLTEDQKRAIHFAAEYGQVSVSDVQRLTQRSWPASKRLLTDLVVKGIQEHKARVRSSSGKELDRDPQARFVIRLQRPRRNRTGPSKRHQWIGMGLLRLSPALRTACDTRA